MIGKNVRKCIVCGDLKPRKDMIKITKDYSSDEVVVNPNSKTFGRSAYLCYNLYCIENAFRKNRLNKVLKTTSNLEKADLIKLLQD